MLKNEGGFLPLTNNAGKKIAVVGPNAQSVTALEGNYNGYASEYVTIADGIRRVFTEADITVERGSNYCAEQMNHWSGFMNMLSDGLAAASEADVTVLALGLDCSVEGEDTGFDDDYTACGDKKSLYLPKTQQKLAEAVCDVCENVIVVLMCGSSIDLGEKVTNHAKAILHAWYPGALGGLAVAEILAGQVNPCAKLPVTIYSATNTMPDFKDYDMRGRTYRYMNEAPLFPFGFGLSYTKFAFSGAKLVSADDEKLTVSVDVENVGAVGGKEKVQVYAQYTDSRTYTPNYQLCAIRPVELEAGEKKSVELEIDRYWVKAILEDGSRVEPDGKIALFIGGSQPDEFSLSLTGSNCEKLEIK